MHYERERKREREREEDKKDKKYNAVSNMYKRYRHKSLRI